ncbi:MAG: DUF420 domain-containing protein, partial [Candidatus Omnitrophica bacterium]|nr:DUF420 domain-containing protein [Candidatus Omnitrophota bacterium]
MADFSQPALNAGLNFTSGCLLIAGWLFIKSKDIRRHKLCMVSAFIVSTLFLISYLHYHAHSGSTAFLGQGIIRTVYFSILISHTILAGLVPFLAVFVFYK